MENNVEVSEQPLGFLDLPTELRIEIYDFFLAGFSNLEPVKLPTKVEVTNATAILYTCKAIFNEAGDSFMKYEGRIYTVMSRWSSEELREWTRRESEIAARYYRLRPEIWLDKGRMLADEDLSFSRIQRARFVRVMDAVRASREK